MNQQNSCRIIEKKEIHCLSHLPYLATASNFTVGSADDIMAKLTRMQTFQETFNSKNINDDLQNTNQMISQVDFYSIKVRSLMEKLNIAQVLELIDKCFFFLNDIYFPYDIELMKSKLDNKQYQAEFSVFLSHETSFFKPLVLVTIALGRYYNGIDDKTNNALIMYSLMLIGPAIDLKLKIDSHLVVSIYTIVSYYFRSIGREADSMLYSSMAMQVAAAIGLHNKEDQWSPEEELKSRIMWVSFGASRTLSAKMGSAVIIDSSEIKRSLPSFQYHTALGHNEFYTYIRLACIGEEIYKLFYPKTLNVDLMNGLKLIIQKLSRWNLSLPESCKFDKDFNQKTQRQKRFVCSLHLNYCYCIYLLTVPLLYSLVETGERNSSGKDLDESISDLITMCLNAATMTVNIMSYCHSCGILAVYGVMDVDYINSAALSLFMAHDVLHFKHPGCQENLRKSVLLMKNIASAGNGCAWMKLDKLDNLIQTYRCIELENSPKHDQKYSPKQSPTALSDDILPNPSWYINSDVLGTINGLTEEDLDIWKRGSSTLANTKFW